MRAGELARFQQAFARALFADAGASDDSTVASIAAQPGFAVYRNTVMKGCVDAIEANFPAVARLVGEDWLRAAAALYARSHPPRDARLVTYGDRFAAFLESFEPAAELTYLPGVARLDYCWCEAHVACDEAPLAGADIASLAPHALARTVLRPHVAARWAWFDDAPVATIWRANRTSANAAADLADIAWRGDGVLITRPTAQVQHVLVDRAMCMFLDACRAGETVEQAVAVALDADPHVNFTKLMTVLIEAGAYAALDMPKREDRA